MSLTDGQFLDITLFLNKCKLFDHILIFTHTHMHIKLQIVSILHFGSLLQLWPTPSSQIYSNTHASFCWFENSKHSVLLLLINKQILNQVYHRLRTCCPKFTQIQTKKTDWHPEWFAAFEMINLLLCREVYYIHTLNTAEPLSRDDKLNLSCFS